jgi:hypothetical protein
MFKRICAVQGAIEAKEKTISTHHGMRMGIELTTGNISRIHMRNL